MHKFVPMLQAMKILDAKATVDKEWERLNKLPAWQLTKVKIKKEIFWKHKKSKEQSILLRRWTFVISKKRS